MPPKMKTKMTPLSLYSWRCLWFAVAVSQRRQTTRRHQLWPQRRRAHGEGSGQLERGEPESRDYLPQCTAVKEPAFVLPISPGAQSPPFCVPGTGTTSRNIVIRKLETVDPPFFSQFLSDFGPAPLLLCSGIFPLSSGGRKPFIPLIKVSLEGVDGNRTNQSRTAELKSSVPFFLFRNYSH